MKRVSEILKEYNISFDRLREFLYSKKGVNILSPATKLENNLIKIIDDAFRLDKDKKASSLNIYENSISLIKNLTKSSLKEIPVGYSKRISIDRKSNLTLEKIFGDCFWGANQIICIDPYIRNEKQLSNLTSLINLTKRFSENEIDFQIITGYDEYNTDINYDDIVESLNKIKLLSENSLFKFSYTLENSKNLHDRSIQVDDKYIIDLSRGLDIFHKSIDFYDDFNLKPDYEAKTKDTTIFITRLK